MQDEIFEIRRFEVYIIINAIYKTILTTNDITVAKQYYNERIEHYNSIGHNKVKIGLFDFDKCTNIEYYDSEIEFC